MIRLSANTEQTEWTHSRYIGKPKGLVFNDNGSYIINQEGINHKGACINCHSKFCIEYNDSELATPFFQAFPHNTSKRVCPTNAISFDPNKKGVLINSELCIACGLCLQRCPAAAIQFDFSSRKCIVNQDSDNLQECSIAEQKAFIELLNSVPHQYSFSRIPEGFSENYQEAIQLASKRIPDISEIIVRNTLVNMGIPCKTNAAGNNHNRTEFFGQQNDMIIIGESNSSETDTLSVARRILDDVAVMVSRYGIDAEKILPLSVLNGLPNQRADYYEVVHDVKSILGLQISTVTFHVLFVLNLFGIRLSINDFSALVIDNSCQDLLPAIKKLIPNIETIDESCEGVNYRPIK